MRHLERRAFTILEVVLAMALVAILVAGVLELVNNLLAGFVRGEQQYSQLRQAGLVVDYIREDVENLKPDPQQQNWGLTVTGTDRLELGASRQGINYQVSYVHMPSEGVVRRTVTGEAGVNLGGGLLTECRFTWGGFCRNPNLKLIPCDGGSDLRRIFLLLEASFQPDSASAQWLKLKTHFFPTWANRRLTSVWNHDL